MTNEEMFENNIRIAYKIANRYKINYLTEYEDIKQIALLGLWKAVLTFKNTHAFSTYAYPVISNEINLYLRKNKKTKLDISINTIIHDNLTFEDILQDEDNIEKLLEDIEILKINQILNEINITEKERKIYKLIQSGYKQQDVAEKFNMSQCQVSRIQKKIINKVCKEYKKIS